MDGGVWVADTVKRYKKRVFKKERNIGKRIGRVFKVVDI